jgi:hypothetical protein
LSGEGLGPEPVFFGGGWGAGAGHPFQTHLAYGSC